MFEKIKKHCLAFVTFFLSVQAAMKAGLSDREIKEVLEMSTSKAIKDKLKSSTQEALDHGVSCPSVLLVDSERRDITGKLPKFSPIASSQAFGFPLVVCHVNGKPEMFFGSDRFELMAHCIGEKLFIHKHT